ncbi:exosome complex component RRP43-like [Palaemon carinicauda]|uniref:exosome complex component RRP43-like n=1 Tax=Palaemon carinicauda TaxID=392227 RepID=UPI0035B68FF2
MTSMEIWKLFEPDNYYKSFLEQNKRPDGRGLTEVRPITINVGTVNTADGSATVRVGNTAVMCGIKAELATPILRKPNEGFIIPNVELYPCCSPKFKAGPPGEKAIAASQFLRNVIKSGNLVDLEAFCIKPNKLAWCLYCDVVCLNYDGNLFDAALISFIAALQNVRLPEIKYDEETERAEVGLERNVPVALLAKPVSSTFTIYNENVHLMDPTSEDEDQGRGEVTVVLLEDGTMCTVSKSGGQLLTQETLEHFVSLGKAQIKIVNDCIAKALIERMDES